MRTRLFEKRLVCLQLKWPNERKREGREGAREGREEIKNRQTEDHGFESVRERPKTTKEHLAPSLM